MLTNFSRFYYTVLVKLMQFTVHINEMHTYSFNQNIRKPVHINLNNQNKKQENL